MKIGLFLIFTFLFIFSGIWAQAKDPAEADALFTEGAYGLALPFYLDQLKLEPANPLLNYKAGLCYLHSRSQKDKALEYLENAVKFSPSFQTLGTPGETEAPLETYGYL